MIQTTSLSDDLAEKLADYVLEKSGKDPFKTAQMQIILPTRRACRTIKEAFLRRSLEKSLLLPKLIPLYELDDLATDVPEAMPALDRTLLLSKLCAAKPNIKTPDQAIKVALSLGELLDEFYQFEVDTKDFEKLVPDAAFAEHWNETIVFLDIITKMWPKVLAEHHQIDEVDRRIRMINAYTKRLKNLNPSTGLIAAGLDGGLPAVRRLLGVVDLLDNGLIWLDGANTTLSNDDFKTLPQHHYQNSIKQILDGLQKTPKDIQLISSPISQREKLVVEALKPETKTEEWRYANLFPDCLDGITRIDCETISEEALTIALLLRGVLEIPQKTAALVTPDRNLARRVILEMKRWGVTLDDSAGTPLPQTDIGIYLRLLATVGISGGKDSDILALLKHPLSADGKNPMSFRKTVKSAEKKARQEKSKLQIELKTDLTSFISLFNNNILTPFEVLLKAHLTVAEDLGTSHDRTGSERLWSDEAGSAAFSFLTNLLDKASLIGEIEPAFYPDVLNMLLGSISIRPKYGMHPRLDILGPIEARFHHPDVCIIGGLNESVFPGIPDTGPWLNRPMRLSLGLPSVESKIASIAMDFAHCFCSPCVYLTRSKKSEGAETIPSRFLSRLSAVLKGSAIQETILSGHWAKELDTPKTIDVICRPAPKPPIEARPKELSVTKIELWMRNPYAIYARYILRLFPLEPLENNQKQQIYGSAVHRALELFIQDNPNNYDKEKLMELAQSVFKEAGLTQTDIAFYLPRFEQTANFIITQQTETTGQIAYALTEQKGSVTFDVSGKPFTLNGTADRIDVFNNGTIRLIDYKTGDVPSLKEVSAGYAPQLPLEAFLISMGGVSGLKSKSFCQLAYWKLAAKEDDCKVVDLLSKNDKTAENLIQESFEGLKTLIYIFNQPETPYEACPIPGKAPKYNDYEHLSRSAEWIHGEGSDE